MAGTRKRPGLKGVDWSDPSTLKHLERKAKKDAGMGLYRAEKALGWAELYWGDFSCERLAKQLVVAERQLLEVSHARGGLSDRDKARLDQRLKPARCKLTKLRRASKLCPKLVRLADKDYARSETLANRMSYSLTTCGNGSRYPERYPEPARLRPKDRPRRRRKR